MCNFTQIQYFKAIAGKFIDISFVNLLNYVFQFNTINQHDQKYLGNSSWIFFKIVQFLAAEPWAVQLCQGALKCNKTGIKQVGLHANNQTNMHINNFAALQSPNLRKLYSRALGNK